MKRIILLTLLVVAGTMIIWSQVPQAMNYKAIAKDDWGVALPSKTITLRFTILEGSGNGPIVYQEVHTTATNKFGLMDVEIGKGTPVMSSFDQIDWSTGVYYIQIEMDPKGGSDFRLEDPAHQLLSVPYALFAGTSENFTETDPYFTTSPSFVITSNDIDNWESAFAWGNHAGLYKPVEYIPGWSEIIDKPTFATVATSGSYNDLNNKPIINGSETKVTAGTNVTITGVGTDASPYVINSNGGGSHYIGESYGGGIVFYVYDKGQHGLIAATVDQSTGIRWHSGSSTNTMAYADGVGAGKANTAIIIANQGYGDGATYAARVCNEYSVTVNGVRYGDWYLPSSFELDLLYLRKSVVGGFENIGYWSSTEGELSYVWGQSFGSGYPFYNSKGNTYCVRAIRAF